MPTGAERTSTVPRVPLALQPALDALVRGLRRLYGERLAGVVLFGSYARGEATAASDVDLAVLLHGPVHEGQELERMSELVWQVCLEHDLALSVVPVSLERYQSEQDVFLWRLRAEGVPAA